MVSFFGLETHCVPRGELLRTGERPIGLRTASPKNQTLSCPDIKAYSTFSKSTFPGHIIPTLVHTHFTLRLPPNNTLKRCIHRHPAGNLGLQVLYILRRDPPILFTPHIRLGQHIRRRREAALRPQRPHMPRHVVHVARDGLQPALGAYLMQVLHPATRSGKPVVSSFGICRSGSCSVV